MPRRIEGDWKDFRDVVSGKIREALKRHIKTGRIVRDRGTISIPEIEVPHIVYGKNPTGVGRGPGKEGDVVGEDPKKGQGAGNQPGEGIIINLDMEFVLKFMQDELELPNLKPKPSEVFEDKKYKYTNVSLIGPESLRHNRRTLLQAIKRRAMMGDSDLLQPLPGFSVPMPVVDVINDDKRYRQYKEYQLPSNNAVIIFARDGSGSMGAEHCDIVSDMSWWIDTWIRQFYKRTERLYVWHDTSAMEVDEDKFYKYRFGGGTLCSSALKYISKQFKDRFPPNKWNIYVFYFTDGDNWDEDTPEFLGCLKDQFGPQIVNQVGITQILSYNYDNSVKLHVDEALQRGDLSYENVRTVYIGNPIENKKSSPFGFGWTPQPPLADEERDKQILHAIKYLLGGKHQDADLNAGDG